MTRPTLHLLAGLAGSGKSTLAARLAVEAHALSIAEDDWTSALWPSELTSLEAYRDRSRRLRGVLWPHVGRILGMGVSVVLDFPANTRGQRAALAELLRGSDADHVLHFLDVPVEICHTRVAARNRAGLHLFAPSPEDLDRVARYFEPPSDEEGFNVRRHPG
jgi:predicted kinase